MTEILLIILILTTLNIAPQRKYSNGIIWTGKETGGKKPKD